MIIPKDTQQISKIYSQGSTKPSNKITIYLEDHILTRKRYIFNIFPWLSILELKKEIEKSQLIKNATQNNLRLFYKNIELTNDKRRVMDYNIQPEEVLIAQLFNPNQLSNGILNPYQLFQNTPSEITQLLMKVIDGINVGNAPKLTPDGTSGTYILQNSLKKKVAIFKPFDEQPYAPNNPRNYVGKLGSQGIRKGILSGQSATRQVAAYILSSYASKNGFKSNYHNVPPTTYVEFYHPSFSHKEILNCSPINCSKQNQLCTNIKKTKHGSLQQFIESHGVTDNFGSHLFDISEVHKIGILDLRILNCDRNSANILVRKLVKKQNTDIKGSIFYELIPIDHGLSFPDNFEIYDYQMTWMDYPQSKKPFTTQQLHFIQKINPLQDSNLLKQKLGFRPICLRNFRISQIFLKKSAKAGFNLYQIGKMVYRNSDQDSQEQQLDIKKKKYRSQFQNLVIQAQTLYIMFMEKDFSCNGKLFDCKQENQSMNDNIESSQDDQLEQSSSQNQALQQSKNPTIIANQQQQNGLEIQKINSLQTPTTNDSDIQTLKNRKNLSDNQKQKKSIISTRTLPKLKRIISLPKLIKKSTSQYQMRQVERRSRYGPNGVSNPQYRKNQQEWNQQFFYYFQQLVDTFLIEKKQSKLSNVN